MITRRTILLLAIGILFALTAFAQDDEKPKLFLGAFTLEEVLEQDEQYADIAFIYIPDEEALDVFRSVAEPVTIKMFYRTDCPDSVREVPRFIKTVQLAGNPRIAVEAIGVNRARDKPADLLSGWDVRRVPTFIVLYEGKEVGRVIETAKVKIEVDLAEMLQQLGK